MNKKNNIYFTSAHIEEIFGINRKKLRYWRKIGIISFTKKTSGGHFRYTFKDLVSIRTVLKLKEREITTHQIKNIVKALRNKFPNMKAPLAEKSFHVLGKEVIMRDKDMPFNPITNDGVFIEMLDMKKDVKTVTLKRLNIPDDIEVQVVNL